MARIFALAVATFLVLSAATAQHGSPRTVAATRADELQVHFLDVGQGDGAVVLAPGGEVMLIDAGPRARGPSVVSYLQNLGVTRIAVLAPSHAHIDQIGGFIPVLDAQPPFQIDEVWLTGQTASTGDWITFQNGLAAP